MYVLVRQDLDQKYRCVQGSHAVCKYAIEHEILFKVWNNGYLIFLGVQNLKALRNWIEKLETVGKNFSVFKEPDLDNQETALACYDLGDIFKDLHLS
jgi:hypothetical protein